MRPGKEPASSRSLVANTFLHTQVIWTIRSGEGGEAKTYGILQTTFDHTSTLPFQARWSYHPVLVQGQFITCNMADLGTDGRPTPITELWNSQGLKAPGSGIAKARFFLKEARRRAINMIK